MKKVQLFTKSLLALSFFAISSTAVAVPQLFIKNNSGYDIAIKFADPNNKGVEIPIYAGSDFFIGDLNDPDVIKYLSVRRIGYGEALSRWVPINVKNLYWLSGVELEKPANLPTGFEKDVYWNIEATYTSWSAKVTTVARKK